MDWQEISVALIGIALLIRIIARLRRRKGDPCAGCKGCKNGNGSCGGR
ncbi:MAG: FeoB-associated Cys-rich membrane protein [Alistipes sp.]|nr:FeoB-associated Cys-rich membrane protein [Alistipes sp.]MDE7070254.1 FeoB-associated Cys-rich membrane protein [Alistipes sp.]